MHSYSAQIRAERFISIGRVVLAASALIAVSATPSDVLQTDPRLAYGLLCAYAAYAVAVGSAVWRASRPLIRTRLVTHLVDLSAFAAMYVAERHLASAFFVFFVFSLLSATMRWRWRGTLSTAVAALVIATAADLYHAPSAEIFEARRVLIHGLYLSIVAILLGYLGVYEVRLRREIAGLVSWSTPLPDTSDGMIRDLIVRVADVLAAPRVLLVWEDREEPWVNLALWSGQEVALSREAPNALTPLTLETLANVDFFWEEAGDDNATVVYASGDQFAGRAGAPLNRELQRRFSIRQVLAVRFQSANLTGRILWLDMPRMSTDQLAFGQLIAGQVSARIDHFHVLVDRRRAAAEQERIRLARDLHDGLLQSLTAMALKLEEVRALVDEEPLVAQKRLLTIQRLITTEQRYLRFFIRHLKPLACPEPAADLDARLQLLGQRVELEWGLSVDLRCAYVGPALSADLSDELYYLISEALVNAARHANASTVRVELDVREADIGIVIADNGQGFPFRGRYNQVDLKALRATPVTLGERVDALLGALTIDSSDCGARIEIVLPRPALSERRS